MFSYRRYISRNEMASVAGIDSYPREFERLKALGREVKGLRRANEILNSASAFSSAGARPRSEEVNAYVDLHRTLYIGSSRYARCCRSTHPLTGDMPYDAGIRAFEANEPRASNNSWRVSSGSGNRTFSTAGVRKAIAELIHREIQTSEMVASFEVVRSVGMEVGITS